MMVSFKVCSIGTTDGCEPAKPNYDINSRAPFPLAQTQTAFDLAISIPKIF